MNPLTLNDGIISGWKQCKNPVAVLQSPVKLKNLLKNRNFGCLVDPSNCRPAVVSVFFQRMQPSGLNQSGTCQLSNPVAEFCSPTVKLVIYLKIATLAAS